MKIICVKAGSHASKSALLDPKHTLLFTERDVKDGPKQMPSDLDITYIMLLEEDDKSIEYRTPDGKVHIIGYQKNLKGLETLIEEAPVLGKGGILSRHEDSCAPTVPEQEAYGLALGVESSVSPEALSQLRQKESALGGETAVHESVDFI